VRKKYQKEVRKSNHKLRDGAQLLSVDLNGEVREVWRTAGSHAY
jgi:hypothetical protein